MPLVAAIELVGRCLVRLGTPTYRAIWQRDWTAGVDPLVLLRNE